MATVYAALRSLMNTISLERTSSPSHPPIPFDSSLIDALLERVTFFVECLEQGWKGAEHLEGRITDLAYAAEDAIESPIVNTVLTRLASSGNDSTPVLTCQHLETIIQDMDSIKTEMMEDRMRDFDLGSPKRSIGSTSDPRTEKNTTVGFEEEKIRIMEELEGVGSSRQVISIYGMGRSGKTTLARTVYDRQRIVEYFDVRAWVTVSQQYKADEMLKQILSCLNWNEEMDEDLLGQILHKSLCGRRYLVILDDIWDIDAWDSIRRFFPDNYNGSRIIFTTRLVNLANDASTCSFGMKPLDEENSWELLCEKVFGQGSCPDELEKVGKRIARNCRGLPLTIVVIGGLLAKSNLTLQYWNNVAEDFNSYLNDDDHCSKILSLSYHHLPIHLKPCFLCMGMFPEDYEISMTHLTHLWIAEGFLKSHRGKIFEEIAEEYLKDLVERNLIFMGCPVITHVESLRYCMIHDLLREVRMKEAQRDCFFYVVRHNCLSVPLLSLGRQRRLVVQLNKADMSQDIVRSFIDCLDSMSHIRSLISTFPVSSLRLGGYGIFKLLRILFVINESAFLDDEWEGISTLVNLRYLKDSFELGSSFSKFFSNISLFRNMQMQEIGGHGVRTLSSGFNIWNWPQVRHLDFRCVSLLDRPSSPHEDHIILENLQTIEGVINLKLDETVCKRIPNIKTLNLSYDKSPCEFMIHNLPQFQKLESFGVSFPFDLGFYCRQHKHCSFLRNVVLPHSIKELCLVGTWCSWKDMTVIGSLPNLETLALGTDSFTGPMWNPVEGEFLRLKLLGMFELEDLAHWNVDCTHFPVLQELILLDIRKLMGIPLDIGEIPTLQRIMLRHCSDVAVISAKNIIDQQRSLGNDTPVLYINDDF